MWVADSIIEVQRLCDRFHLSGKSGSINSAIHQSIHGSNEACQLLLLPWISASHVVLATRAPKTCWGKPKQQDRKDQSQTLINLHTVGGLQLHPACFSFLFLTLLSCFLFPTSQSKFFACGIALFSNYFSIYLCLLKQLKVNRQWLLDSFKLPT